MAKRPWQYLGCKSHCWKAHFFKICFFVKYFHQRLLSLVNVALHAAIIRLSPLIHEGEQQYKPYIVGDSPMVSLSVTPPLKNPGYAPEPWFQHHSLPCWSWALLLLAAPFYHWSHFVSFPVKMLTGSCNLRHLHNPATSRSQTKAPPLRKRWRIVFELCESAMFYVWVWI